MTTRLILVGGFLGAGKTTLLWESAKRLSAEGRRVGLITNDQAPDLVDTALLGRAGVAVQEVAGSCFCCNFPALIDSSKKLTDQAKVSVIIAEPVGSCTDLTATIINPIKDKFPGTYRPAPFTVLADPRRFREVVINSRTSNLHGSAAYIYRKQLEEADLIVFNKTDLLNAVELRKLVAMTKHAYPDATVMCVSALTGKGVDKWLKAVLSGGNSGEKITEVDYDTYAEGEAVLGWLNAVVKLNAKRKTNWKAVSRKIVDHLRTELRGRKAEVGHIKTFLSTTGGFVVANLISAGARVSVRGQVRGTPLEAELIINARVQMSPRELEQLVRRTIREVATGSMRAEILKLRSLSPGRPRPTYRYRKTV
jgi:G3E family GTPase